MNAFTKSGALAIVISNDFWYMHLYSKDEDFDKSHQLTGQYYNNLADQADTLMEWAIQEGYPVLNNNTALAAFPEYVIEEDVEYSYFEIVERSKSKLSIFINALRELRNFTDNSGIQSKIDEWLQYWDKEVNYKLARRTATTPSMLNGFINSGLDNALAYTFGR